MTNTSRVPAGVPTGGQFAASARSESDVALSESVHRPVNGVDNHQSCPVAKGEACSEHRDAPGQHVGDMEILACEEDEDRNIYTGVAESDAEYFALRRVGTDGVWTDIEDYPTRQEARSALSASSTPALPLSEVNLGQAISGYRMNRAAARTALDAYNEAIETPGVAATEAEQSKRLAERVHSIDMAALCTLSSLRALEPHLNSDERLWADRLERQVNDPDANPIARANCLRTVIDVVNVGRLERAHLRQRARDPDDQVFGADRAEAARYARTELAQAQAAYDAAGGGWGASDAVTDRLNRAKRARATYAEYVD